MRPTLEQIALAVKHGDIETALELTRQIEEYYERILGPRNEER